MLFGWPDPICKPGQTGQIAVLHSCDLLSSHSLWLPFQSFPSLLFRETDGEWVWANSAGSRSAWMLDIHGNYHNKNIILTSWWRFARGAFNPHNNPVSTVVSCLPFYRCRTSLDSGPTMSESHSVNELVAWFLVETSCPCCVKSTQRCGFCGSSNCRKEEYWREGGRW